MPAVKKRIKQPDIQLIANAVITDRRGRVLLTHYDDNESRWWLPGSNLEPYEHPEEALQRALAGLVSTARRSTRMLRANRSSPRASEVASSCARLAIAVGALSASPSLAAPVPRANQVTPSGHGYLSHASVSGVRAGRLAAAFQSPRSSA